MAVATDTRLPRRSAVVGLLTLLALGAACGGTAQPAADAGATTADVAAATSTGTQTASPATAATTTPTGDAGASGPLTVYSGRSEELVGSVIADFEEASGIDVEVRYGDTAELAATILNEGSASPADVYWAQDAGALGALAAEGLFAPIPQEVLDVVDPRFRSDTGDWVGVTGRSRVIAYNTEEVSEDELPDSVFDLADPRWQGEVGWAPTNGSFQAFVTAMRVVHGDDTTRQWLEDMLANDPVAFEGNSPIVEALGRGEIELGLVNHYYLYRFLAEDADFPVANHYPAGDIGSLINVAGVGILASTDQPEAAEQFVTYLLSEEVQNFFGTVTDELEYPLREGVTAEGLPSLESLNPPDIDLADLEDLQGTLEMLAEVGVTQ